MRYWYTTADGSHFGADLKLTHSGGSYNTTTTQTHKIPGVQNNGRLQSFHTTKRRQVYIRFK